MTAHPDLYDEWAGYIAGAVVPSVSALKGLGVSFPDMLACGGLGGARAHVDGDKWRPDDDGAVVYVQPAYVGGIPSIYNFENAPIIADLIAWRPKEPARWWLREGERGLILGALNIPKARFTGKPLHLFRTPLSWLRAGGRGVCFLDWHDAGVAVLDIPQIVAEDLAHGNELDRRLRGIGGRLPRISLHRGAAA